MSWFCSNIEITNFSKESEMEVISNHTPGDPRRVLKVYRENKSYIPESEYLWGCDSSEESIKIANVMINEGFIMIDDKPFFVHHSKIKKGFRVILFGHHLKTIEGSSTDKEMQSNYPMMCKLSSKAGVFKNTQICFVKNPDNETESVSFRSINEDERSSIKEQLHNLMDDPNFYSAHNLKKIARTLATEIR